MGLNDQVEEKAREAWGKISGHEDGASSIAAPAHTELDTFELCINEDEPGHGTIFPTIEEAKAAGYAAIRPTGLDGASGDGDPEAFFTVHRVDAQGRGSALAFNSNQADAVG